VPRAMPRALSASLSLTARLALRSLTAPSDNGDVELSSVGQSQRCQLSTDDAGGRHKLEHEVGDR
jgi:hypothetical protein